MTATEYLVWGVVAHCVADWMLQNDWMAVNKTKPLESPANAVHSGIHFLCLACVFPLNVAFALAWFHGFVDTRWPLEWLRNKLGQAKPSNPIAITVKIWHDQVVHLLCIAIAALLITR